MAASAPVRQRVVEPPVVFIPTSVSDGTTAIQPTTVPYYMLPPPLPAPIADEPDIEPAQSSGPLTTVSSLSDSSAAQRTSLRTKKRPDWVESGE